MEATTEVKSMEATIEQAAKEAYDLVHEAWLPENRLPWDTLVESSKVQWRLAAKHVLTQGVAIGAMDRDLTQAFLVAQP